MKVLLLSAYDADSHKRWRRGLVAAIPDWQWTVLSLPPRYFSWRVRGNSLSWGRGEALSVLRQPWDLIVATSMTDLSSLRGLVPELARVPTAVYFHENQFDYPRSEDAVSSVEPQLLNIYTALSGDLLLFNSEYNRNTLLQGAEALLQKLPDHVPAGICREIADKSRVLPVPLERDAFMVPPDKPARPTFIWNHRWEYDKGPDILLAAVRRFGRQQIPFTLHVVGQQFRRQPSEFAHIRKLLDKLGALGAWGYRQSLGEYRQLLGQSHAVISTARHDFQGLAVLEAVAAGCQPLVPDNLAYPEWFGRRGWRFSDDVESCAANLSSAMLRCAKGIEAGEVAPVPDISDFSWDQMRVQYHTLLSECASGQVKST
ncbi:tRNA-queuosine alpha-mannosyltransferase domain-containing protein [Microbulbifer sp. MCCC 1A16149]|uniref:tRNA-queuosine alpha-mannosyltransferase domain-containing protein n=1 Tax=Microbulbifer sp. MCCC 1A16149 TaxID=3411322 RepID=UPI003D14D352